MYTSKEYFGIDLPSFVLSKVMSGSGIDYRGIYFKYRRGNSIVDP